MKENPVSREPAEHADRREANRAYQAALRAANPAYRERGRADSRARGRAHVRLAAEHPEEFHRLYAEELAKENRYRQGDTHGGTVTP